MAESAVSSVAASLPADRAYGRRLGAVGTVAALSDRTFASSLTRRTCAVRSRSRPKADDWAAGYKVGHRVGEVVTL